MKARVLGWFREALGSFTSGHGQRLAEPRLHIQVIDDGTIAPWSRVRLGGVATALVVEVLPDRRLVLRADEDDPDGLTTLAGESRGEDPIRFEPDDYVTIASVPDFAPIERHRPVTRFRSQGLGNAPYITGYWLGQRITLRGGSPFHAPPNLGVAEIDLEVVVPWWLTANTSPAPEAA